MFIAKCNELTMHLVEQSQFFPGFDLNAIFTECISDAYQLGWDLARLIN
jgi:hypothetical protein